MKTNRGYATYEMLVVLGMFILVAAFVVFGVYTFLSNDADNPPEPAEVGDTLPGQVKVICLDGYEYYYTQSRFEGLARAGLALKIKHGAPSECVVERKEP